MGGHTIQTVYEGTAILKGAKQYDMLRAVIKILTG